MATAIGRQLTTWWQGRATRARAAGPSSALFAGVRRRLTFWYVGVLAAALLLAGGVLYVGVRYTLLNNVDTSLVEAARPFLAPHEATLPAPCRPAFRPPLTTRTFGIACFGADGTLLAADDPVSALPAFTNPDIVRTATTRGAVFETVNAGGAEGAIRRYAVVAPPAPGEAAGVVLVVGRSVQLEMDTLRTLFVALVATGLLALAVATLGGLFLSARALDPVRLGFQRQQAFIADAAHELRTPLTLMRADADVLLRSRHRFDPEDAALVEDIAAEALHMSTLTTTMLDMARLDAGQTHLEREVVDLAAVVRAAVQRTDAYARTADVALSYRHTGDIRTLGDPTLLTQATLILVDNAIKYNRPTGSVVVHAERADGRAVVTVTDTGIGITADDLRHLGERFYRADKARSRETGGAGLGIAIARAIAALHGGALTYKSVPGEGTTATLVLPAIG